ncbi:MAG: ornithine carbamoyltransferase [Candidatus Omnitrophota bacterium]|nr:ornithine carbamoyltransferase [Candidatus Omnitrophota bacterium]
MKKDFISITDLTISEISSVFSQTVDVKKNKKKYAKSLLGKTIALIFQKPSLRTRVSFEVGVKQLGGSAVYLGREDVNLGVRESISDVAKTLSRYVDGIVARTFDHKYVLDLARYATVPVINGLSDLLHPCQALADIFTIQEKIKQIKGTVFAYVGDGNNVCNSLLHICAKLGINVNVASPMGYSPQDDILAQSRKIAGETGAKINIFFDASSAVKDADVIYTDVWTSMGQEQEREKRIEIFKDFQINKNLVSLAKKDCLVMHCLPAHRGEEITEEVIESKNSVIFDQAENRLHAQKAIMIKLLGEKR